MRVWPAIDVKDGKCVRLSQGDIQRETVYGSSPADMAIRWVAEGATGLHIIDLDGAIGRPANFNAIASIADQVDVDIQVGGGIRDERTIEDFLTMGIKRLIISTQSVTNPQWTARMAERYSGHLLVSIDTRGGQVTYNGWQNSEDLSPIEHARNICHLPLAGLIYTNIDRAGMMTGPDLKTLNEITENIDIPVIASGGVKLPEHLQKLRQLRLEGCVIGKALYDGHLTLPESIAALAAG